MTKRSLLFTILLFVTVGLFAQEVSKTMQRANKAYEENNYKRALENYLKASSEEAINARIARQIGNCYRLLGDMPQAQIWYENSSQQPDHKDLDLLLLGYVQKANGKNELSAETLNKYYSLQKLPELTSSSDVATFAAHLRNGFLSFRIVSLSINSPEADFSPSIYQDAIVYASSRFDRELARFKNIDPQQHLNLFSSKFSNIGEMGSPVVFSNNLLNQLYTGPIAFSPSGDTAYFVQKKFLNVKFGDEKQMSDNNLKIHRAILSQGQWISQGALSFCTDKYSVGDPAVSPDGKRLYFTSDMPGGVGGADLYYREIQPNGKFGEAVNLGTKVNTSGNEMTPFIAKDGTLFFSSDTQLGFGYLDLFAALPTKNGFDYVSNLGYPINGPFDDFGLTLSTTGDFAFFSSNRPDGAGDDDIYKLVIDKKSITHSVEGQITDEKGSPVSNATIKIFENKVLKNTLSADVSGKFTFNIDDGREVNIQIDCKDFLSKTEKVSSFGLGLSPTKIPLKVLMSHDIGYTLTGTVLSAVNGLPIANAQVIAYPPDSTKAIIGISDQLGRINFKLESETSYRVRLIKDGFVSKMFYLTTKNRDRGEINLSNLFDTKLAPDIKPGISGAVTDAKSTLSLSNAIVTLSSSVLPQNVKLATNEIGSFNQSNLPEGIYDIKIEKEGYQPLSISVKLEKQPIDLNNSFKVALEPVANSYVAVGLVTNKEDNTPVSNAVVTLLNKSTNEKVQGKTDEFGSFDFKVEPEKIYILRLEKDKYFAKTIMIITQGIQPGMFNLNNSFDLKMEAIVMNKAIEIPNIYYDLGKSTIKPEAAQELDKVVKLLSENPTIQIELSSHTDARGDAAQNLVLSQKRAEAAVNYIVSKGIEKSRMVAKGYGDKMIKNRCTKGVKCSEEEHAVNRRTEIKVLKF